MTDTRHYKQLLLERRRELLDYKETGDEAASTVELDQTRVGRLSRMDALQAQAISKEGNRRRDLELKRIAAALRRLDEDDYGYCLKCGEEIAEGRLKFDPATELCITCAEQSERRSGE